MPRSADRQGRIGIQILLADDLWLASIFPPPPLRRKVEPWSEVLKRLVVVATRGNDGAEHRRERVTWHAQPVCPRPVLASLVDDRLTDIKEDRLDDCGRHVLALAADSFTSFLGRCRKALDPAERPGKSMGIAQAR